MDIRLAEDELYCSVGRCLANWSKVEFGVAALYCSVNDQRLRVTEPALKELEDERYFNDKRDKLRKLVRASAWTEGRFRDSYSLVDRELKKSARLRAEVAHFTVVQKIGHSNSGAKLVLRPFFTFSSSCPEDGYLELSADDVKKRAEDFDTLATRVSQLTTFVRNVRGLLEYHESRVTDLDALLEFPFRGHRGLVPIVG